MIIHFVSTQQALEQHAPLLRRIVDVVVEQGHSLTCDKVLEMTNRATDPQEYHRLQSEALARADVVIAEATLHGFDVGYQVSKAIHMRKPTLVLSQKGSDSAQFARGIDTGIEFREYTEEELPQIITSFLATHDVSPKDMRFNFFLTRETFNYLRWAALKTGKTKAEVLRGLVEREIQRDRAGDYKP